MATTEEWAAMNGVNPHFTFRERTAFLVGYRLARHASAEERAVVEAAKAWAQIVIVVPPIDLHLVTDLDRADRNLFDAVSALAALVAAEEK